MSTGHPATFQGWDARFKSGGDHCGYGIKVITSDCGSENPGSIPGSHPKWVGRIVAIAADCKSADFGLRWFESNPAHLYVCVSELVEGTFLLRRCAANNCTEGSNPSANAIYYIKVIYYGNRTFILISMIKGTISQ